MLKPVAGHDVGDVLVAEMIAVRVALLQPRAALANRAHRLPRDTVFPGDEYAQVDFQQAGRLRHDGREKSPQIAVNRSPKGALRRDGEQPLVSDEALAHTQPLEPLPEEARAMIFADESHGY